MGVPLQNNFKQSEHIHYSSQHIFGISHGWLKKIYISMRVSLLEKQIRQYGDHLEKIPIMCC